MKKGITTTQIKQAAGLVHKAGIHWTGYFLMGVPTETKQEMLQTLNLMLYIKPDFASLSVFEPYPGTELHDKGIAAGYMIDDRTLDDYYSMSPKYYFMKRSDNRIDTMTDEEFMQIEKYLKNSFHKYNRGTARILKRARARSILYRKEPAALLGDVRKFLAWLR